jgi:hypothetical protein
MSNRSAQRTFAMSIAGDARTYGIRQLGLDGAQTGPGKSYSGEPVLAVRPAADQLSRPSWLS